MKQGETETLLQKIDLFRDLSAEELAKIGQLLIRRVFRDKDLVFLQAQPLEHVYFIAEGKVKICRTDEHGREQVVNLLQTGDFFPHAGFFQPEAVYPADAVLMEDGVLLALPNARFGALLQSHPALCMKLLAVLEGKYMELQGRLKEMVLHDTFGRIVKQLLRLARMYGQPDGDRVRLTIPLTNQELANMIGTSRETVNRTLSQLRRSGAVEVGQDHHLLIRVDVLEGQL
jgi:CRP/FNR family cyclic AMP-dependent transcriptional regulator